MSRRAVECECGERVPVPEGAESSLLCPCTRFVILPQEEEFAKNDILISASTLERRIKRLADQKLLPPDRECAWCGAKEAEPVDIRLVCERSEYRESGRGRLLLIGIGFVLLTVLLPIIVIPVLLVRLIIMASNFEPEVEVLGRDNTVSVPICVCEDCARTLPRPEHSNVLLFVAIITNVVFAGIVAAFAPVIGVIGGLLSLLVVILVVSLRRSQIAKRWETGIKDKLCQVPVYAQLLEDYPNSSVMLAHWLWVSKRPRGMSAYTEAR